MKPLFHYTPKENWMNDPNGLCQVNGVYHMYYQYNPDDSVWGNIHWGHAVSNDLLHWETRPVAMKPDRNKGEMHCFSGGCCKDKAGRSHFFYTSIGAESAGRGSADGAEQWYAEPVSGNLDALQQSDEDALRQEIHGGLQIMEWRDPCVLYWKGQYLMVLGGLCDQRGCVLLYTSTDMRTWIYRHILVQSETADGRAYECPNLFQVDGRMVLLYSPYGPVEALVGDLDEKLHFHVQTKEILDPGGRQGFYAPQVMTDEQWQVILQGWAPECDGDERARQRGYSGAMNLPRILSVKDGFLYAEPLQNVWTLMQPGRPERHFVAEVRFRQESLPMKVTMLCGQDDEETVLLLDQAGSLVLDRSSSSRDTAPEKSPICRNVRLRTENRLFLSVDGTLVECCVNGQWLSGRVYPTDEKCGGFQVDAAGDVDVKTGVMAKHQD